MQGNGRLKTTQWLMAFEGDRSIHGYPPPGPIPAGATHCFIARPQVACRIDGLLVDRECGNQFVMLDLRIGRNSKTASTGAFNLAPFAVGHATLAELLELRSAPMIDDPDPDKRATEDDVVKPLADLGAVLPGQDLCLVVRNDGTRPRDFRGGWLLRSTALYEHSTHGERRMMTSPPETCEVCSTILEELAHAVHWCATCGSAYVERRLRPSAFSLVAPDNRLASVRELVTKSRGF